MSLKLLSEKLLLTYLDSCPKDLSDRLEAIQDAELSTDNFSFYTSVAAVYSSKIEGESVELDSYIKHKREGIAFHPDYTRKIDDLYEAYSFAKGNQLTESHLKQAHQIFAKHLLASASLGVYRRQNMFVASPEGKIEYVAAPPHLVEQEMNSLFEDISQLLETSLAIEEVFFYATLIHLVFVKIHPWNDGNGRSARLLEKWFLAEKLGDRAWFISSEKMYYQNHQQYYNHLRALGLEYEELDHSRALPFLWMLPQALT